MSATQRSQSSYLTDLMAAPHSYELLQALRLVQHEVSMGYAPIEVRYRASLSLAYPQAEIESMSLVAQDNMEDNDSSVKDGQIEVSSLKARQIEFCPAVIGLTGPLSALPAMYTDHLASRVNHVKDKAAPAFLDLFNHRLTDLYVQSSWFYNLPLQYELNHKTDSYLLSLRSLARQPKKLTSIDSLIAYAGMISPGRLTADQLAQVLSHFLDSTVSVQQFVPEWFDLPASEQTALGGQHAALGLSTFCGARVVQFDSKIRIVFHQLDAKRYLRLLPAGDMYQVIIDFIRKWCGVCLAVEMQLELDKQYITPLSLSESGFGGLGQGGFLVSQPATHHYDDTRYALPIQ
ncbi:MULTISPECIES: type VI secretion system baseplate subunit TssG [unclassified Psychrobacter]|uniref:type VI secretion system baseplate subunit TssG n=1 Tax=unclassified Psychrobacter TaxID=196806 RepID=UPI0025B5F1E9|nr:MULTISPECIES: type VI secretion system baseplate subunit TssG [unclassified Psychrobacter]MDN3453438.1 type VI secretion system baseplate subunit TssG [Psychrobacter sp. APC 3350]MDN3502930.1 type VI secretion system baseplate subunit TssG [Psychrobacter sp. 5A.1]